MANYKISGETLAALGDATRHITNKPWKYEEYYLGEELLDNMSLEKWGNDFDENGNPYVEWIYYYYRNYLDSARIRFEFNQQDMYNIRFFCNTVSQYDTENDIEYWLDENNSFFVEQAWGNFIEIKVRAYVEDYEYGAVYAAVYAEGFDSSGESLKQTRALKNTMTPSQMAETLSTSPQVLTDTELTFDSDLSYLFSNYKWNWFIEKFGNKIKINNASNTSSMFNGNLYIKEIPFNIEYGNASKPDCENMFYGCEKLKEIPKLKNLKPKNIYSMFANCKALTEIPESKFPNLSLSNLNSSGTTGMLFINCFSLRTAPVFLMDHGSNKSTYTNTAYHYSFSSCYLLDEIIDLPVNKIKDATFTKNIFSTTFNNCSRIKRLTFKAQTDGSPYVCSNWSKQLIDLSQYIGYAANASFIEGNGLTANTRIIYTDSYIALKDNPDSWTTKLEYSRYNHDSAVETINSLPDVSAGSNNGIKFKGAAGSATDGGAINTLTEEEIAVATAKGWTVSFV